MQIDLRRPHVLPEAMLQIRLDAVVGRLGLVARRRVLCGGGSDDRDLHFVARPCYKFAYDNHPREIVERYFARRKRPSGLCDAAISMSSIFCFRMMRPGWRRRDAAGCAVRPAHHPRAGPSYKNVVYGEPDVSPSAVYGIDRQAILETEVLGNQKWLGAR